MGVVWSYLRLGTLPAGLEPAIWIVGRELEMCGFRVGELPVWFLSRSWHSQRSSVKTKSIAGLAAMHHRQTVGAWCKWHRWGFCCRGHGDDGPNPVREDHLTMYLYTAELWCWLGLLGVLITTMTGSSQVYSHCTVAYILFCRESLMEGTRRQPGSLKLKLKGSRKV